MALVGVKLKTLVFETDALTTRPPPCALMYFVIIKVFEAFHLRVSVLARSCALVFFH